MELCRIAEMEKGGGGGVEGGDNNKGMDAIMHTPDLLQKGIKYPWSLKVDRGVREDFLHCEGFTG